MVNKVHHTLQIALFFNCGTDAIALGYHYRLFLQQSNPYTFQDSRSCCRDARGTCSDNNHIIIHDFIRNNRAELHARSRNVFC